jgi:hypothetical protein
MPPPKRVRLADRVVQDPAFPGRGERADLRHGRISA